MDLRILEIAAHTENNKVVENYTHKSKHKNPLCGDEMEISLIVKEDVVKDMGYQCKSCVYCQASVSLLSRKIKEKKVDDILSQLKNNAISKEAAKAKIMNVQNVDLCDITEYNVDEVIDMELEAA